MPFTAKPDGTPFVLTVNRHIRFVRLPEDDSFASGDDLDLRFLTHITITPDGTLTSEFSHFELTCS